MNRYLLLVVALLGTSRIARADGVSLGYTSIPLQREYLQTNEGVLPTTQAQNEATFGAADIQVLYTVEKKATDKIHMTLITGVGLPMGSAKFNLALQHTNVPAVSNNNAMDVGDTEEVSVLTVPVLVGANYRIPMGDNSLTLGISVGAMLIGSDTIITNVAWKGAPGAQTENGSTVTYVSSVAPAYAILASIGYNIKTGEGESIGITVPLGTISAVRMDTVTTTPGATPVTADDGWKAGGFAYAIQVGWNKQF